MCNEHMECDAVMPDIISFNEERKSYINPPRPSISIPLPSLFHFFTLTRISSGCMHVLERGVRRKKRRGRGEGGERGGIDFWGLE